MRTQRAPVLLLASFALVLPGCAVKRWLFGPPSPQSEAPKAVESPSPAPPAAAAETIPPPPLQWDFSQHPGEGHAAEPPETPPPANQIAKEAPASLPPPPVQERSPGLQGLIPGFVNGHSETEGNPQYVTEEDLLKVVAEFQRVAGKDTYRFPIPKDVTGANIYKATLTRLQDYEAKHPGAYPDLIAFTRGRAYEGVHEYEKATAQYQLVSQSKSRLNAEATKAIEVLTRFQEIRQRPLTAGTPLEYLQALDDQSAAWQELQQQYAGTPYEALAREEEERLDRAKVAFLELNRYHIEDGNESVVLAYRQLIGKHKESKNIYRYQIEFGDFYFTLAQEYVAQSDPQTLQFDPSTFEDLGRTALRLYAQVAQEDGVMEKLEAKGKLEALEAYMATIGRLGR
jgi:hypothetical protein